MKTLPPRSKVKTDDCWDLGSLFKSDDEWERAFKLWESDIAGYSRFAGTLAESAERLAELFEFDIAVDRAGDRLSTYAFLKTAEDVSNSKYQDMMGRNDGAKAIQNKGKLVERRPLTPYETYAHALLHSNEASNNN